MDARIQEFMDEAERLSRDGNQRPKIKALRKLLKLHAPNFEITRQKAKNAFDAQPDDRCTEFVLFGIHYRVCPSGLVRQPDNPSIEISAPSKVFE